MRIRMYRRPEESSSWYAQVYVGGRRYRFTCRTRDRATAHEYARRRTAELEGRHDRGLVGLPEPVRVSEIICRYEREELPKLRPSSATRASYIANEARRWFVSGPLGDPPVGRITPTDIAAYLDRKAGTGLTARTVNLHRAILHRIFRLCVRPWLLIPGNPVAGVEVRREEQREPLLPTPAQYEQLLAATESNPMLHLFVVMAYETGARSGELLQLEWSDVDFDQRCVTFLNDPTRGRQTKGRRSRTVPLSGVALRALRDHAATFRLSNPRSSHVFKHTSSRSGAPGSELRSVYKGFKRAARAIGLPNLRRHDLRHLFVSRKLTEGVPAHLVSRYVGHANLATTQKYFHLVPEHLRGVVDTPRTTSNFGENRLYL